MGAAFDEKNWTNVIEVAMALNGLRRNILKLDYNTKETTLYWLEIEKWIGFKKEFGFESKLLFLIFSEEMRNSCFVSIQF